VQSTAEKVHSTARDSTELLDLAAAGIENLSRFPAGTPFNVDIGVSKSRVVEVEQRHVVDHPTDTAATDRQRLDKPETVPSARMRRDVCARDRRASGAAIACKDVTVDGTRSARPTPGSRPHGARDRIRR